MVGGGAGVARADGRWRAVEGLALDRTPDHEVVTAPAMIGPVAVGGQRAAKVRGGEGRDLVGHTQIRRRSVEDAECIAEFP